LHTPDVIGMNNVNLKLYPAIAVKKCRGQDYRLE
jgi:hypothetical protein